MKADKEATTNMTAMDRYRFDGIEEGRREGRDSLLVEIIQAMPKWYGLLIDRRQYI